MNALHAKLIANYCKRPELEAMLLDERLAYFAMHEAEKVLRENQFHFVAYTRELWSVVFPNVDYTGDLGYLGYDYIHATAAQRAEAFLRTLNLWKL